MHRALPFVALVLLAGCGGDDEAQDTGTGAPTGPALTGELGEGARQDVPITETEFKLDPSTVSVPRPGTVVFRVANQGNTEHALAVEGHGIDDETPAIQPGATEELTLELGPGDYDIYCPIGDHADKGMRGTLTVKGP